MTGRRLARASAWTAAAAVVALLGLALALTERLDGSPLRGSEWHASSVAALDDAAERLHAGPPARGPLRAGWGRAEITPPLGTPTLGYGARAGRGTVAVADPLSATALALAVDDGPPVVILTADLCLWSSALAARVAAAVADAVPRERLYLGATHTHNGPGGFVRAPAVEWSMGGHDPAVAERIAAGAADAVRRALAASAPARWRTFALDGAPWVGNRARRDEPLHDALRVVEVERADGARAALVVFAAHATAIDPSFVASSGDYPGALVRGLRARGLDEALFLAGPTGQAEPRLDGELAHHPGPDAAYRLGDTIAAAVVRASTAHAAPLRADATLAVLRSAVALPPWRVRLPGPGDRALRPAVAGWLLGQRAPRAHLHAVRLDDLLLVGHSFEFSAVLARDLAARARARGLALAITSLNGDHAFYVVPPAHYDLPIYEAGMTFFGPDLGPYLADLTARAVALLAPRSPTGARAGGPSRRWPGSRASPARRGSRGSSPSPPSP